MKLLGGSRVGRRFLGAFVLLSLPIVAAGWFGIRSATEALLKQTHTLLHVASDGANGQLREFLVSLKRTTESRAADEAIRSALKSPQEKGVDLSEVLKRLRTRISEVQEIFCMDLQGKVVASSSSEMMGKDEASSTEFQLGRQSLNSGDIVRDPASGAIQWRMSAPVKDPDTGRILGVVALGIDPGSLSALTTGKRLLAEGAKRESFRMGETGETYIVNRHGLLLTESRFSSNSVLALKVKTAPVRAALERNEEIIADYKDYRGVAVSGASAILPDMGWVLVTEIDFSQASAPIKATRDLLVWLTVAMGSIAAFTLTGLAKRIVNPLQLSGAADHALALGDEQAALVPEENLPRDEIGDFIRQRNINVKELFERERELLKEQKARADAAAALEGVSYSMVHDMRAPLRAIASFGDLIAEEAGVRLTATEKDYLAHMKSASLRMDRLLCDMLRYSSLLRADVLLAPVNVSVLLRWIIAGNPAFAGRKDDIEVQEGMPVIQGDVAVLTQCFVALLDNAFRYARPGVAPKVRVWAESKQSGIRIFVADNGIGIPEAFQQRLFGIFQKGTAAGEGTGIGLALVRVAAERMGGHVGVISEEGKGSRFWIELRPTL